MRAETPPPVLRVLVVGAGVAGLALARGMLRDGHDVTVFEQRPHLQSGGGAVTIWPNGATVLDQLGVDMAGAGQELSAVRVMTSTGRRLATLDVAAMAQGLGAPVRMVPRRVLLQRLVEDLPAERIRYDAQVVGVSGTDSAARIDFADGSCIDGDLLIGADGLHSMVREHVGAPPAESTGWCSWQGLVSLPRPVEDPRAALMIVGRQGNLGLWPAGGSELQWWFDLPWSPDFVRPPCPIDLIRARFEGWSDPVDQMLAVLTDADLAGSPYPHFRHPIPGAGRGALTLVGDAAHTMPPTMAQGTNQALLDTMVLCRTLARLRTTSGVELSRALRRYEQARRRKVAAVSRMTALQLSHSEMVLRPAAWIPDRLHTWGLTLFLRSVSHRRMASEINRSLGLAGAGQPAGRTTDRRH
ncbi:FAD-dependent oxidoreductase [Mycolicibacter minnesotensis]|uniref:FAD-dependent oxidoreductase n=2 Tax=Mycolicibacter minnesotensis TaxID=1118379 RepID=UPI0021F3970E|nr:NAD(P)/FAD-dependent oxidoreductase [Mycolicibacter minnesotensis]